jgi:hypothetical protein
VLECEGVIHVTSDVKLANANRATVSGAVSASLPAQLSQLTGKHRLVGGTGLCLVAAI